MMVFWKLIQNHLHIAQMEQRQRDVVAKYHEHLLCIFCIRIVVISHVQFRAKQRHNFFAAKNNVSVWIFGFSHLIMPKFSA
jgi:hypothetical protein